MGFFTKIFGTYSQRQLKKLERTVNEIEELSDKYAAMSDGELAAVTPVLKERLASGETLDDILPDAFAAVREAAARVLGKRPFRVQLIGGIVLHQGRIAEMKTGEGKTLVAVLPAYLNALAGNGVHIVTVNEYLAKVGYDEMGRVYSFMGLTTGLVYHDQDKEEKRRAYACDITYGTNNELGFDYLRDNMVVYKKDKVQRGHAFAIVDEVDSILIDEARTPLIISGAGEESTELYEKVAKFTRLLKEYKVKELDSKTLDSEIEEKYDFTVDEKARSTVLTASGVKKAEKYFNIDNLADPENSELVHHINQAIKAIAIMHRDDDYIIDNGKVIIVDSFTGRLMPGRRYSDGLHQAIEAKEKVKIQKESKTLATITFQNFFRLYTKLSGMTGTALTEDVEFREIYALDVVEIPTNKPMIRIDHADSVYATIEAKYKAICNQIKECNEKGQPVLVGTVSVDKSEILSKMLSKMGVAHKVLNAKQHAKEADIVAGAGRLGAVTIATNMAGRGTDIMLGGNAEHLAKQDMRRMIDPETKLPLYSEEIIGAAVGASMSVSQEVLAAREVYKKLYEEHKKEIEPLAKKVKELGGLYIIGTERHESRRIDNQLRGRAGRQGDEGESRFFLSLQDDLMRLFGSERVIGLVSRGIGEEAIVSKILTSQIEKAQRQLEGRNFHRRKTVLGYDDIMNEQRKIIYKQRDDVLNGEDMSETVKSMITFAVKKAVRECLAPDRDEWSIDELKAKFLGTLCTADDLKYTEEELDEIEAEDIEELLLEKADKAYKAKEELFGADLREFERVILLRNVDKKWIEHLDAVDDLKDSVGLQAYAQRDPITEFRIVSADMFDDMISEIKESTAREVLSLFPAQKIERAQVAKITGEGFTPTVQGARQGAPRQQAQQPNRTVTYTVNGISKNSDCPCGSGKKYKQCCGKKYFRN